MSFTIISREDAFKQKLRHFYEGKLCKYGHDSPKFVSTNGCVECGRVRSRKFSASKKAEIGHFVYPLKNMADYPKAWAYCQALDIGSGFTPTTKDAPPETTEFALPPWLAERQMVIAETQQKAIEKYSQKGGEPYLPKL